MFDIKGEYKITLPPNPVFSGNRKIGKYFNRKIFLPTGGRHPRSLAPVTDIGANTYRPLATGSQARSCCSCMLQSLSGNDTDTPKEYRRTGGTGIAHTGYYRQTRSCMCVHHHRGRHHREDRDTGGRQAHRLALSPLYASISFGLPPNPVFWRKVITACYSL